MRRPAWTYCIIHWANLRPSFLRCTHRPTPPAYHPRALPLQDGVLLGREVEICRSASRVNFRRQVLERPGSAPVLLGAGNKTAAPNNRSTSAGISRLISFLLVLASEALAASLSVRGMSASTCKRVGVIGAGPVGIEAAVHLVDAGFSVTVL